MQSICLNGICWGCILKWYIIQGTPKLTQVTYVLSTVCKTATLIWMLEAFANLVVRGFCKELAQSRGGCNAITVTGLPLGLLQLEPLQRVCWYVCVHLRWLCNCYLVGFFLLSDRETYCKRIRWCRHTALCTVDKVKAIDSIIYICWIKMFSFWNLPYLECAQKWSALFGMWS